MKTKEIYKSCVISDRVMLEMAELCCKNAPNKDWQNRGLKQSGISHQIPVKQCSDWENRLPLLGTATVSFFKFLKPVGGDDRDYKFVGFTLAVLNADGKIIYESCPVINKIKEDDLKNPATRLSNHFCPKCLCVDTVKQRSKIMGPECIQITYYCKCGYKDFDVLD